MTSPAIPPRIRPGGLRELGLLNHGISAVAGKVLGRRRPHVFTTLGRQRRLFRGWLLYSAMLMPFGRLPRHETELVILHIAYIFIPLGLLAISLSALGYLGERSVLHLLSVGAIACMMLAVMTRASLGHTGRALVASKVTVASYAALILCALVRPLAEILPDLSPILYAASGLLWITAFGLYCLEYAPMLARKRRAPL